MPRGKRTVFFGSCSDCGARLMTVRLHKQKAQKTWKDFKLTTKYCGVCRKRTKAAKLEEEKHSSG